MPIKSYAQEQDETATMTKHWAVKWPKGDSYGESIWVHWTMMSSIRLGYARKRDRTIFTDLKLARAAALVTGGKVWRVKS
jgi:hypothetical protein